MREAPELRCHRGKPFVAYLTTGERPLRIQAEAEGWGHAAVDGHFLASIPVRKGGVYRIALYCCHQQPCAVFAPVDCPEGSTLNAQLIPTSG